MGQELEHSLAGVLGPERYAPAPVREASARVFVPPAARLDDAIERNVIEGNDLSQGDLSFAGWQGSFRREPRRCIAKFLPERPLCLQASLQRIP
jgi:hypothetical protein